MDDREPDINVFVPLFRTDEILEELRQVLDIGWTGAGYRTVEIEEEWNRVFGFSNSLFLNSATAALHLSLETMKSVYAWGPSTEIISTPLTFVSTNHAILHAGLTPVFADVDEYLCLDPESLLQQITKNTRAVIFVGLGGSTGQLARVAEICSQHGLKLILDAAHMAGAQLQGIEPGHLADAACFSFQAVKNLPTFDSGLLCFKDEELHQLARQLSWLGISKDTFSRSSSGTYAWRYNVDHVGFKYNGNSVAAVMALVGLKYLNRDNAYRRRLASRYHLAFDDNDQIIEVLQPNDSESSRHLFQIRVEDREGLIRHLHDAHIYPGVHYRSNTDYPMYRHLEASVPSASLYSHQILSLPLHLRMSDVDISRVIDVVNDWTLRR